MHPHCDRNHVHFGNQIQNKRASEIKSIPVSFWKDTMSRSLLRRIFAVHLPFPTPNSTAFHRLPRLPSTTITPLNSLFSSSPTPHPALLLPRSIQFRWKSKRLTDYLKRKELRFLTKQCRCREDGCGKSFKTPKQLDDHYKLKHNIAEKHLIRCTCGSRFRSAQSLSEHKMSDCPVKGFRDWKHYRKYAASNRRKKYDGPTDRVRGEDKEEEEEEEEKGEPREREEKRFSEVEEEEKEEEEEGKGGFYFKGPNKRNLMSVLSCASLLPESSSKMLRISSEWVWTPALFMQLTRFLPLSPCLMPLLHEFNQILRKM
ncbi:uncharacterized protein [Coffea arabica]|uniref:C2H2-type domain-containing protein n=1 Tax=Coffea arabica TaxID=13443 RepID=A0ABM4WQD8_COFAR